MGGASAGPSSNKPSGAGGNRVVIAVIIGILIFGVAYGLLLQRSKQTGQPTTEPSPSPTVSATPTVPPPTPTAKAERKTFGSMSVMVPAGALMVEPAGLKEAFALNGITLVAAESISSMTVEEIQKKIEVDKLTEADALKGYWRFDILQVANADKLALAAWITKNWPEYDETQVTVEKSTEKIGKVSVSVHKLVNKTEGGLQQTIYFAQPKSQGDVVLFSTFLPSGQALKGTPVEGLIQSAQFE